eukprot:TRINITY_DN51753_c0_g1_i1.p1 TRINITY_DN51753_c0_g1~~TRINITY_DN51753_c0_g1_i1.p1  ORF type:complete len:742 (+),score=221.41 TRINITY_DN51753_c0_g1_i1:110-2335(+)
MAKRSAAAAASAALAVADPGLEEDEPSDGEYEVRRLAQSEDLVIDGDTAVDDMLVAQRIAEQETFVHNSLLADVGRAHQEMKVKKTAPSQTDVSKLLRLLRQTNKLSKKISDLPDMFSGVVGEQVREAFRMASEAVEQSALAENMNNAEVVDAKDEEIGEETWDGDGDSQAAALAGVDLESTDEETAAADAEKAAKKAAAADAAKAAKRAAQAAKGKGKQRDAEEDDVADEPEDEDGPIVRADIGEKEEEEAKEEIEERGPDPYDQPPMITTAGIPEKLPDQHAIEPVGFLFAIVQGLFVVCGDPDSRPLDLQSVLCTADRDVLGVVIDVFGPVAQPHYLIYDTVAGRDPMPEKGEGVYAAVDLPETSYICDSADLEAIQQALQDRYEGGADSSEEEEVGDEDAQRLKDSDEEEEEQIEALKKKPGALATAAMRAGAMAAAMASGAAASGNGPPPRGSRQAALPPPPPRPPPPPPPKPPATGVFKSEPEASEDYQEEDVEVEEDYQEEEEEEYEYEEEEEVVQHVAPPPPPRPPQPRIQPSDRARLNPTSQSVKARSAHADAPSARSVVPRPAPSARGTGSGAERRAPSPPPAREAAPPAKRPRMQQSNLPPPAPPPRNAPVRTTGAIGAPPVPPRATSAPAPSENRARPRPPTVPVVVLDRASDAPPAKRPRPADRGSRSSASSSAALPPPPAPPPAPAPPAPARFSAFGGGTGKRGTTPSSKKTAGEIIGRPQSGGWPR